MTVNDKSSFERVLRLLSLQRKALADAGADANLLGTYNAIVRHLSKLTEQEVETLLNASKGRSQEQVLSNAQLARLAALSLEEIEAVMSNEHASRKQLEAIAVSRFHVPKGSLRSFQNVQNLREKLFTMIRNERAHQTISEVARGSRE